MRRWIVLDDVAVLNTSTNRLCACRPTALFKSPPIVFFRLATHQPPCYPFINWRSLIQVVCNMEWLHFSDFHFAGSPGPQGEAMGCLVDYIQRDFQNTPGKIDAIFLVGDIAFSGKQAEYDRFTKEFLTPLLSLPSLQGAKVFAVPGNHDVDCDASTPITWDSIQERNRQVYFCENEAGQKARKIRTVVFQHYQDFVTKNGIISPNSFEEVSLLLREPAFPFDILAVNTSFFSDKDEKSDKSTTPCPITSVRDRLNAFASDRPLMILGHHSFESFLKPQQKPFESFLIDRQAVYLHGHEHDPKITSNIDGTVRTIGFGATYLAPLGTKAHAPYRNSFTTDTRII